MEQRLTKLRALMRENGLDALLVLRPENRRYLSGFTGSTGQLIVTHEEALLFVDGRYTGQAKAEAPHCRIVDWNRATLAPQVQELQNKQAQQLGFEKDFVTFAEYHTFQEAYAGIELVPTSGLV